MAWTEWLQWLFTGTNGFILYWSLLFVFAALELIRPSAPRGIALAPRLKVNFGLGIITAALGSLPFLSEIVLASTVADHGWGLLNRLPINTGWQIAVSFLAYDLFGYGVHRLEHRWQPLWRLHRIHHSDNDMDLTTLFRTHPLSALLGVAFHMVLIVSLGIHPVGIILHEFAKLVAMGLGHAKVAASPRLSSLCSLLVVTPAFHAFHHSACQPETDSNYGEVLTIWDHLLGTTSRRKGDVDRFGLGDAYDSDAASLAGQLKLPFISR